MRTLNTIPARPVVFGKRQWRSSQRLRIVLTALIATPCLWALLAACMAVAGK